MCISNIVKSAKTDFGYVSSILWQGQLNNTSFKTMTHNTFICNTRNLPLQCWIKVLSSSTVPGSGACTGFDFVRGNWFFCVQNLPFQLTAHRKRRPALGFDTPGVALFITGMQMRGNRCFRANSTTQMQVLFLNRTGVTFPDFGQAIHAWHNRQCCDQTPSTGLRQPSFNHCRI